MAIINANKPTGSCIFNYLPGTIAAPGIGYMNIGGVSGSFFQISHELFPRIITKSFEKRLFTAEFDDSIIDTVWWANTRYKGWKTTGKAVNVYTPAAIGSGIGFSQIVGSSGVVEHQFAKNGAPFTVENSEGTLCQNFEIYKGDETYGSNPAVQNQTTAIFIANTIIGGKEENEFADLQNHSYIGIQKILIVNIETDTVDVISREQEDFQEFHRFITNDLPTGRSFKIKILDESVGSKLKQNYFCKMNKGWLLKSFEYRHGGEPGGGTLPENTVEDHLTTNNGIYFYRDGEQRENLYINGVNTGNNAVAQAPISGARLRYANINYHAGNIVGNPSTGAGGGDILQQHHIGPSFSSSSIHTNKYTRQFYSGSFGNIENRWVGTTYAERLKNSDLGQASRFIGVNCLDFLQQNNSNDDVPIEEKTELHVTFLEGVKDFSVSISGSGEPGNYKYNQSANDERSIGTFEVDQNQTALDVGDHCHGFLPQTHEIIFKGSNDGRFMPVLDTFDDRIDNAYLEYTGSFLTFAQKQALVATGNDYAGCAALGQSNVNLFTQPGVNLNRTQEMRVFLQGGALGAIGFDGDITSSNPDYKNSLSASMTVDNYYGSYINDRGTSSLEWQLSFLDKDHVIIANIDKDEELFDGIGTKGVVIIPQFTHPRVRRNLDLYLQRAGLIDDAPGGITNVLYEGT